MILTKYCTCILVYVLVVQEVEKLRPHMTVFMDILEQQCMPLLARVASAARDSSQPAEFLERHLGLLHCQIACVCVCVCVCV